MGVPQGSVLFPALFNYFLSDCPTTDSDLTSYADDFSLLASGPSIEEAEADQHVQLLYRASHEGPQRRESPIRVELWFHDRNLVGQVQGHFVLRPELRRPQLVHSRVLNPSGQTWGDPE